MDLQVELPALRAIIMEQRAMEEQILAGHGNDAEYEGETFQER